MPLQMSLTPRVSARASRPTSRPCSQPYNKTLQSPCIASIASRVCRRSSSTGSCGMSMPVFSSSRAMRNGFDAGHEPAQMPQAPHSDGLTATSCSNLRPSLRATSEIASNGQSSKHRPQPLQCSRSTTAFGPSFFGSSHGISISATVTLVVSTHTCPAGQCSSSG